MKNKAKQKLLQVLSQSFDLLYEEVDVGPGGSGVGDDHAKEVDLVSLRLVAHHSGPGLHHHRLDLRGHLSRKAATEPVTVQSREGARAD